MIKGDLKQFSPGDLLTFLAHLRQDGVLTVQREGIGLNLSFRGGMLADAQSDRADGVVLHALRAGGLVDAAGEVTLRRDLSETGLPLRRVLENLEDFPLAEAHAALAAGVGEVLFQLFVWETGEFRFAEFSLDQYDDRIAFDPQGLALEAVRQVDEYREVLRSLQGGARRLCTTTAGRLAAPEEPVVAALLQAAATPQALGGLLEALPVASFALAKSVEAALAQGWLELEGAAPEGAGGTTADLAAGGTTADLAAGERAAAALAAAGDERSRMTALLNFCKERCPYTLLIAARDGRVTGARRFEHSPRAGLQHVEVPGGRFALADDPAFGERLSGDPVLLTAPVASPLLAALGETPPAGAWALVGLGRIQQQDFLLCAATADGEGPLPLLAQLVRGRAADAAPVDEAAGLVAAVRDLPPMPQVVGRLMELLNDPDCDIAQVTEVLSTDQSLVARLIKVSNSSLYARGHAASTLSQAVIRLGTRTVQSLVLAASTRSLFPLDQTRIGLWGQTLWRHSVECGLAARRVAELVAYDDPEEAFVAGVLHDLGKVVLLLNRPDDVRAVYKLQQAAGGTAAAAERRVLGFDHARVGCLLLDRWQMPPSLKACVEHHHQPLKAGEFGTLALIVACGNHLSHRQGASRQDTPFEGVPDLETALGFLGLASGKAALVDQEIARQFELSDLLD